MKIEAHLSSLKGTRPHEYALRFFFGGLATLFAGVIAKKFGPSFAGLFLAFPAIFPASATMLERHEKEKRQKAGLDGTSRSRTVASIDAAGASIGSLGLVLFAVILWRFLPTHNAALMLAAACFGWITLSFLLWYARKCL